MYFLNHIVRCSITDHPNKRAIVKMRFYYSVKNRFFSESLSWFDILDKAYIFWEAFLHNSLMWLLKVSLLSIVTPSIFSSFLLFMIVSLKMKVSFSLFLPRHIKWHFPAFRIVTFSQNHFVTLFKSLSKISFTSSS